MNKFLRKLRGLAGFGATWGMMWAGIGAGIGTVIGIISPDTWAFANPIFDWALGMGLYGFVSGVGFGTLLSFGESRKTIMDLSLSRVALWGVLGSAAVPLVFGLLGTFEASTTLADVAGAILVTGSLGGTFAPTTVALARRGELQAPDRARQLE